MTEVDRSAEQAWPITDEAVREAFAAMIADGSWGRYHGPHCERLATAIAEFHGAEHVRLCTSGTAAVELALRGAGVGPGDEVIMAAYDFKANFINVRALQAVPVLIDTLPGRPVMDPARIEQAVTERTRAIICSHLHGSLTPMKSVIDIVQSRRIAVIEDACQSPGAIVDGRRAGTHGDVGILSFGGSKLLTAGRGGALLIRDARIAQRIAIYCQRGNEAYPLSEMQAAVLLPQLHQLEQRNQQRLQQVRRIVSTLHGDCILQPVCADSELPVFYKLAFLHKGCRSREDLLVAAQTLRAAGLAMDPAFPALHRIHSQRSFRMVGGSEQADRLHHRLMTLHHPILLSDEKGISELIRILNGAGRPAG